MNYEDILIFGKNGQLARCLAECLPGALTLGSGQVDFTNLDLLKTSLEKASPSLIINAAAYTAVDRAEDEPKQADLINAAAPEVIAVYCKEAGVPMIHFSTDYVFSGNHKSPYTENDEPRPLGVYGSSKYLGEQKVLAACDRAYVFRVSWLYSEFGSNFLLTMLRVAKQGKPLKVVDDQVGTPTYAMTVARAVSKVVDKIRLGQETKPGIYHLSPTGICSWYEFAKTIFAQASQLDPELENTDLSPIPTDEFPTKTERPSYSKLSSDKFVNHFDLPLPSWEDGLELCLRRIYGNS